MTAQALDSCCMSVGHILEDLISRRAHIPVSVLTVRLYMEWKCAVALTILGKQGFSLQECFERILDEEIE